MRNIRVKSQSSHWVTKQASFRPHHGLIAIFAALAFLAPTAAEARIPTPRVKPASINHSQILSDADTALFEKALSQAKRGDWLTVKSLRSKISNPVARDTLYWLRATRDARPTFSNMDYVVRNLSDWPRMTRVRAKAEAQILDNPDEVQDVIGWFGNVDPVSGEGRIALARAYYAQGNEYEGHRWLRYGWQESSLTRDRQKRIYSEFKVWTPPSKPSR